MCCLVGSRDSETEYLRGGHLWLNVPAHWAFCYVNRNMLLRSSSVAVRTKIQIHAYILTTQLLF